jgi:hypothetical protein
MLRTVVAAWVAPCGDVSGIEGDTQSDTQGSLTEHCVNEDATKHEPPTGELFGIFERLI